MDLSFSCVLPYVIDVFAGRGATGVRGLGLRGARGAKFLRGRGARGIQGGRGMMRGSLRGRNFTGLQGRGGFRCVSIVFPLLQESLANGNVTSIPSSVTCSLINLFCLLLT